MHTPISADLIRFTTWLCGTFLCRWILEFLLEKDFILFSKNPSPIKTIWDLALLFEKISNNKSITIDVESIEAFLTDMGDSWKIPNKPVHEED